MAQPLWPHLIISWKVLSPNTATTGVRATACEFWGTQTFSKYIYFYKSGWNQKQTHEQSGKGYKEVIQGEKSIQMTSKHTKNYLKCKFFSHSYWQIYKWFLHTHSMILMVSDFLGLLGARYYAKHFAWITSCCHQTTLWNMHYYTQATDGELETQWSEARCFVQVI